MNGNDREGDLARHPHLITISTVDTGCFGILHCRYVVGDATPATVLFIEAVREHGGTLDIRNGLVSSFLDHPGLPPSCTDATGFIVRHASTLSSLTGHSLRESGGLFLPRLLFFMDG